MNPETLLLILVSIIVVAYLFDQLLRWLNLGAMNSNLPEKLKSYCNEEEYRKTLEYQKLRTRFAFITSTISFVFSLVVFLTGLPGWLDELLRESIHNEKLLVLAFFGIIGFAGDILSMPFSLYSTFSIESRYGFNKTTPKTWILDKLKGYLLAGILGGGFLYLFLSLVESLGPDFWLWFWGAIVLFMLVSQILFPVLIMPLFNKLTPLEEGPLREAIEDYSKKVNFPLSNIFVMDGSRRSTKANAFFTGIGRFKRIVLYDTLIEQHSKEELVAVLAHEIGHFKKRHVFQAYLASILQTGLLLFVFSRLAFLPELSYALGAQVPGIHLSLLAVSILFSPVSQILALFMNLLSRKNEYEADYYAATTYKKDFLKSALIKLQVKTLSNFTPHPAFVFVYYSHPPLLQRLKALDAAPGS